MLTNTLRQSLNIARAEYADSRKSLGVANRQAADKPSRKAQAPAMARLNIARASLQKHVRILTNIYYPDGIKRGTQRC